MAATAAATEHSLRVFALAHAYVCRATDFWPASKGRQQQWPCNTPYARVLNGPTPPPAKHPLRPDLFDSSWRPMLRASHCSTGVGRKG
eukprot:14332277-Alexandrium_andersonii.AAC.1